MTEKNACSSHSYLNPAIHAGGEEEVRRLREPAHGRHALCMALPRVDVCLDIRNYKCINSLMTKYEIKYNVDYN